MIGFGSGTATLSNQIKFQIKQNSNLIRTFQFNKGASGLNLKYFTQDPDQAEAHPTALTTKILYSRVVDPYPDPDSETLWIRIRNGNPDPGARK
jgi:hypothetical protein